MDTLFLILFFLSIIGLIIGLIRPRLILRKDNEKLEKIGYRKAVGGSFAILTILFFILFGITAEPTSPQKEPKDENQTTEQVVDEKSVIQEEPVKPVLTPLSPATSPPITPPPVTPSPTPLPTSSSQEETFNITYVVDGDTVEIEGGERVRLIGIDSPERGEPYYSEAKNQLTTLVLNKQVRLEKDITDKDRYGRLLRYIYVDDLFINVEIVKLGYAKSYTYPPDVKYQNLILSAERDARNSQRGLWAQSEPTPVSQPQPQTSASIICSSNAYNCTDFTTHAEAQSVYEQCGGVNNDVHKLDQDKDGLACEDLP